MSGAFGEAPVSSVTELGLLRMCSCRQGSGPADAWSGFLEGGCVLFLWPGCILSGSQRVTALPLAAEGTHYRHYHHPQERELPGPAFQMPGGQTPPFSYLSAFFFTQPFHLFIYQIFIECFLALALEVQQWIRASGSVLMELSLHNPDALKANVMPSSGCYHERGGGSCGHLDEGHLV